MLQMVVLWGWWLVVAMVSAVVKVTAVLVAVVAVPIPVEVHRRSMQTSSLDIGGEYRPPNARMNVMDLRRVCVRSMSTPPPKNGNLPPD